MCKLEPNPSLMHACMYKGVELLNRNIRTCSNHVRGVPLKLLYLMPHCIEVYDDGFSCYWLYYSSVPYELDGE